MATIALYLAAENKQKLSPMYIRYVHNRESAMFKLSYSIPKNFVDFEKVQIKKGYGNREKVQRMIDTAISRLKKILAEANEDPTTDFVKEKYNQEIEREIAEKEQNKLVAATVRGLDLVNQLEQEELNREKKAIEAHPFHKIALGVQKNIHVKNIAELTNLFEKYLKYKNTLNQKKRITKGTGNHYRSTFNRFVDFANHPSFKANDLSFTLSGMSANMYTKFFEFLSAGGMKDTGFGSIIKVIKGFLKWCEEEEELAVNKQYKKWERPRDGRNYPQYLSDSDVNLIWEYANNLSKDEFEKKRLYLCCFGNWTGLRISEILASKFKISEMDNDGDVSRYLVTRTIKNGKNGNEAFLPLYDSRIEEILVFFDYKLNYITAQKWNEKIKISLANVFNHYGIHQEVLEVFGFVNGEKTLLKNGTLAEIYSSHDNRRSFITRGVQEFSWDRIDVADMVGSKVASLEAYVKTDNKYKHMRMKGIKKPV